MKTARTDLKGRAIAIAGASARSANNGARYALTVFGRSTRESNCDCDRSMESSLLQTVFLQNDSEMLAMLERPRDGWIGQIGQQAEPENGPRIRAARAQVKKLAPTREALKRRVARLGKSQAKQAAAAKKQLAKLENQLASLRKTITEAESAADARKPETGPLVQQAYLRTLSRLPTDSERDVAHQYIAGAASTADGLRDLMWALLNTKEFIVNH
jgi:hypothetical protein